MADIDEGSDAVTCPNGHAVDATDLYCEICGASTKRATLSDDQADQPTSARSSDPGGLRWRWFAATVALVLLLASAALFVATRPKATPAAAPATTTTASLSPALAAVHKCSDLISGRLDSLQNGEMSNRDVALEFGTQSATYREITTMNAKYESRAYSIGREKAAKEIAAQINRDCDTIVKKDDLYGLVK